MKKIVLVCVTLLALMGCNLDLYTSEYNSQRITYNGESFEKSFDGSNPAYLSASKARYTDKISLSWTPVVGADYYVLYRAEEGSDAYEELPLAIEGTSYDDEISVASSLEAGLQYRYRVYAYSHTWKKSLGSEDAPEAVGSVLALTQTISAEKGKHADHVTVTWSPVVDASGYAVYVKSPDSPEYVLSGKVSANQTQYRYAVAEKEKGEELYFKVATIGTNNVQTSISDEKAIYAIGFSLVPGAPGAPSGLTSEQGQSISYVSSVGLKLTWNRDANTPDYQIYRSAPGQNEELVYPYGSSDPNLEWGEDDVVFTDKRGSSSTIKPGVRYTYTVIPLGGEEGSQIKGSPASVDAYLLSNPDTVTLSLKKYAYVVSFSQTVGLESEEDRANHSAWRYLINASTVNGATKQITLDPSDYHETVVYEEAYDTLGVADDQYTIFSVQVVNENNLKTAASESQTILKPGLVEDLAVTKNRYVAGMSATSGIFPIHLSWKKNTNIDHYELKRFDESGISELGSATISGANSSYDDAVVNAQVGTKYSYTLQAFDVLGRSGDLNEPSEYVGYGALTGSKFIEIWSAFAFKPFAFTEKLSTSVDTDYQNGFNMQNYWNSSSIKSKVDKGNSSSLSTQMDALTGGSYIYNYCHYKHGSHTTGGSESNFGSMGYSASTEGVGGQIYFTFEDFGEVSYMYTNGKYEMHVDASGTGSAKSETNGFTVEGMYPATIKLGNITVKSKAFSGNYSVRMSDGQGTLSVGAL